MHRAGTILVRKSYYDLNGSKSAKIRTIIIFVLVGGLYPDVLFLYVDEGASSFTAGNNCVAYDAWDFSSLEENS